MPFPVLIPVAAAGVGFVGGLFTSDALGKLTRLGLLFGGGYLIYTNMGKK
jgi:hypothetical protein